MQTSKSWDTLCAYKETGIMYDVPKPLTAAELVQALNEFMKQPVKVPVYKKEDAIANAIVTKNFEEGAPA